MEIPGIERSLMLPFAVWIQYMSVTYRQTDGQTDKQRIVLRGKNVSVLETGHLQGTYMYIVHCCHRGYCLRCVLWVTMSSVVDLT